MIRSNDGFTWNKQILLRLPSVSVSEESEEPLPPPTRQPCLKTCAHCTHTAIMRTMDSSTICFTSMMFLLWSRTSVDVSMEIHQDATCKRLICCEVLWCSVPSCQCSYKFCHNRRSTAGDDSYRYEQMSIPMANLWMIVILHHVLPFFTWTSSRIGLRTWSHRHA